MGGQILVTRGEVTVVVLAVLIATAGFTIALAAVARLVLLIDRTARLNVVGFSTIPVWCIAGWLAMVLGADGSAAAARSIVEFAALLWFVALSGPALIVATIVRGTAVLVSRPDASTLRRSGWLTLLVIAASIAMLLAGVI
jgi:hypothetical protein